MGREPDDPRKAKTLDEACRNPDGSYNGFRLVSWLSAVCFPGAKGMSPDEAREIYERVKRERGK